MTQPLIVRLRNWVGDVVLSIGVAEGPKQMQEVGELLAAADKALYVAKESGRNRVCAYRS